MEGVNTKVFPSTAGSGPGELPFDATVLFKALQYQLLVAVEYCHDLTSEESLWIEVSGDVTVPGRIQTEVKHYTDSLTDSHANFWNTVKNWMHDNFKRTSFKSLVLLTTQEFGAQSELRGWNERTSVERLEIMENIFASSQATAARRADKQGINTTGNAGETSKPTKSLSLQQYVMDSDRRDKLIEILERIHITTGAADLAQRIQNYRTRYLTMIRPSKCQQFIDDLLGFMWSYKFLSEGWQITQRDFSAKFTELTRRYMKHPDTFPGVDTTALKATINVEQIKPMRFAQKIAEIGGERHLKKAALHRLVAETVISDLYSDGVLFKTELDGYMKNHLIQHQFGRERAMLNCADFTNQVELKKKSESFYLERNSMDVAPFCGMDHTRIEFRNGIYHLLAGEESEDEDEQFHWRLW
ncbi:hypothetical protein [Pectobacterium aroidearum]|uniref:hypothetical protein n=1 Tax=Pectobacterium aroidearum TaxID=1201031 RepID=UPI0026179D41|nr:hypothetical protein [Pectobacterium aroidearum]WKA63954.1 hypothetical protein QX495_07465 [Pectobacterium aroidearum]